ncbi:MAG: site-specific DNA-methyltransferase [Alphaproteobacteria bacterium GM7ARS4]|nr:site-specific DNA-methyltransferase [Alphaproteobacteria bacterium GM7ARS4]
MIYIDPPYNTRSDEFIYKDNFVESKPYWEAHYDLDNDTIDSFHTIYGSRTHSGWLAFMYPRLRLARDLLRDDGVIYISIDEHEQANLKLMCDEIFGEENHLGELIRKTKSTTNDPKNGFNIQHEYCCLYARKKEALILAGEEKDFHNYKNPDNDPNGLWVSSGICAKRSDTRFPIKNPYTGKVDYPPKGASWRFSESSFREHIKSGKIVFKKAHKENERGFIFKRYLHEVKSKRDYVNSLFATDNAFMNQVATKEGVALMGDIFASYPKPVSYLEKIIFYTTSHHDIILDFFAGSGTTAHAVMKVNAKDGGERSFIMVEWNEKIDKRKFPDAHQFCAEHRLKPVISSITIERIKRAGDKLKGALGMTGVALDTGYKVFSLAKQRRLAISEGALPIVHAPSSDPPSSLDVLYNLIMKSNKDLHEPFETIEKDALYRQGDTYYVIGKCDTPLGDKGDIHIDGFADIDLEQWLNSIGLEQEGRNVVVHY